MYKDKSHRSSISSFRSYIEEAEQEQDISSSGLYVPRTPAYFIDPRYLLPSEVKIHFPVPRQISSSCFKDDIPFRDTATGERLFTFYGKTWTLWDNKTNTHVAKFRQGGGYLQFEDHYNIFVGHPKLEKLCRLTVESGMRKCKVRTIPNFVNQIMLERKYDGTERSVCYLSTARGDCIPVARVDNGWRDKKNARGRPGQYAVLKDKLVTIAPNVDIAFVLVMCIAMALHFDQNMDFKLANSTI